VVQAAVPQALSEQEPRLEYREGLLVSLGSRGFLVLAVEENRMVGMEVALEMLEVKLGVKLGVKWAVRMGWLEVRKD